MAKQKIRYGIVGLGHIAQQAVLPAFENASSNSTLAAFVSDDDTKLKKLGRRYGVRNLYSYDQYDECIGSGEIDAVYIALPNDLHREYAVRAANAGIHILSEKPLAVTTRDCQAMIKAAEKNDVRLMTAYRLHFEQANLESIQLLERGKIGEPRIFNSVFTMNVKEGDTRLQKARGGGSVYDIGIYCINAARYLFRAEPTEVLAMSANNGETRFAEVEEMLSAIMRFPGERLASFTVSFGASDVASYRVVGTSGDLVLEPAYEYAEELRQYVTVKQKTKEKSYGKRDQFAPELIYFSDCIIEGLDPEPSGLEGLIDVSIIEAIYRSARERKAVKVNLPTKLRRPTPDQQITRPAVSKVRLVHTAPPKK